VWSLSDHTRPEVVRYKGTDTERRGGVDSVEAQDHTKVVSVRDTLPSDMAGAGDERVVQYTYSVCAREGECASTCTGPSCVLLYFLPTGRELGDVIGSCSYSLSTLLPDDHAQFESVS